MEESILISTKKILGLDSAYTAFDQDVLTHINSTFSTLNQLGVGPDDGLFITDETAVWSDFICPANQLHMTKSYMYAKVRLLFDPPATSFAIEALKNQILEFEVRLNVLREEFRTEPVEEEDEDV